MAGRAGAAAAGAGATCGVDETTAADAGSEANGLAAGGAAGCDGLAAGGAAGETLSPGETLIVSAAAPSFSLATAARWLIAVAEIGCPQAPQNRAPSSISASQCGQRD